MVNLWNWLDWVLALVLLFSTLSGVSEGLARGIIGLASLVVALVAAAVGYMPLGERLRPHMHSSSVAYGTAFLLLFIAVLIVGALVAALVHRLIKSVGMRWLDRFLGFFFGILRGIIVDVVIIMAMLAFSIQVEAVRRSKLAPPLIRGSQAAAAVMPAEIQTRFNSGLNDVEHALHRAKQNTVGGM
jgi:membrane protein required for colicin V production